MPELTDALAVVVGCADGPGIDSALHALTRSQLKPSHIVVVSPDRPSPELLSEGVQWIEDSQDTTGAVNTALEAQADTPGWIWIIHDDSRPHPNALAELMRAVANTRSIGVAGCKQVELSNPDVLISVGTSYTRFGARYTGVETGELDQGQLDGRDDVYAVGTAGMLVRADVWRQIGGADPNTSPWLDGVDISRRALLAGHRVVVVPRATIAHGRRSLTGESSALDEHWHEPALALDDEPLVALSQLESRQDSRSAPQDRSSMESGTLEEGPAQVASRVDPDTYAERRRALLFHRVSTAALPWVPLLCLGLVLTSVLRFGWRILTKQLRAGLADLGAPWRVLLSPVHLFRSRRRWAKVSSKPRSSLAPLLSSTATVRAVRRDRRRSIAESRRNLRAPSELEIREQARLARKRRWTLVSLLVAVGIASLIALAPLAFSGPLVGGVWLGTDSSYSAQVSQLTSGWLSSGSGYAEPPHPFLGVLVVLATLTGGPFGAPLWLSTNLLVLGTPVLAAWAAWVAAGALTRSVLMRFLAGLGWAMTGPLWLLIGHGGLPEIVIHLLLPWVAYAAARTLGLDQREVIVSGLSGDERPWIMRRSGAASLAAVGGGGLALVLITASVPVIGALVALILLFCALLAGPARSPGGLRRTGAMLIPAAITALPVMAAAVDSGNWTALLRGPTGLSVSAASLSAGATETDSVLLAIDPLLLVPLAVVAVIGIASLLRRPPLLHIGLIGWLTAAGSLSVIVLVDGVPVSAAFLSTLNAGVLLAAGAAFARSAPALQSRSFGVAQVITAVVTAVVTAVFAASMLVLPGAFVIERATNSGEDTGDPASTTTEPGSAPAWWADIAQASVQVRPRHTPPLSALGVELQTTSDQARVLAVGRTDTGIEAQLWRGPGYQFSELGISGTGAGRVGADPSADEANADLIGVIASLTAGAGEGVDEGLARHGIALVVVPPADSPYLASQPHQRDELIAALDGTEGIDRVSDQATGVIYRVNPRSLPVRAQVLQSGAAEPENALLDDDVEIAGYSLDWEDGIFGPVGSVEVPPAANSLLVLAERRDSGWRASIDGTALRSVSADWRQTFEIPPGTSGQVQVHYDSTSYTIWLWVAGIILFGYLLLSVPLSRRHPGTEEMT